MGQGDGSEGKSACCAHLNDLSSIPEIRVKTRYSDMLLESQHCYSVQWQHVGYQHFYRMQCGI